MSRLWSRYERFLDEYPLVARSMTAGTIAGCAEAAAQSIAAALSWKSRGQSRQRRRFNSSSSSSSFATSASSSTSTPSSPSPFEARRVALWFLYGAVFSGPAGHMWQKLLASYFASKKSSSSSSREKERKKEKEKEKEEDDKVEGDVDVDNDDNDDDKTKKKNKKNSNDNKSKELLLRVAADSFLYGPFCNAVAISFIAVALERRAASSVPGVVRSSLPPVQTRAWKFWPLVSLIAYSKVPPKMRVPFFNVAGFLWGVILITASKKKKKK